MVKDVKDSVAFYINNLGFKLRMAVPETQDGILSEIPEDKNIVYALVYNDNVDIQFQLEDSFKDDLAVFSNTQIGASVAFYMETESIEKFYNEIYEKVEIVKELDTAWYGMKEFYIRDNNGYILGFSEQK